jgi:hypothetical protein
LSMIPLEQKMGFCSMNLLSVYSEMVDFGSGQGRSDFETGGVVSLRRGFQNRENAGLGQKMLFPDGHC